MRALLFFLLAAASIGCATTHAAAPAAMTFDPDERIYDAMAAPESAVGTTIALAGCDYGFPEGLGADEVDTSEAGRGLLSTEADGILVTVQVTRAPASVDSVAASVYRRQVNEVPAPFYGYAAGIATHDEAGETFGFAVGALDAAPDSFTRGFVRVQQDPSSGRVVVLTATWDLDAHDDVREARLRALAAAQTLYCG